MSNIFGWIGQHEQRDILLQAGKHMRQVVLVVELLKEAVEAMCNGDPETTRRLQEQLSLAEHEADILRRDLLARLSQGLLLPPDRQDLVQLVNRMDDVADYAQGAARLLVIFQAVPEDFAPELRQFADILTNAVHALAHALESIAHLDAEKALAACTEVETWEEDADQLKAVILERLFSTELSATALLLMRDLIESMENTADKAEDTADLVRVLAVAQKR